MNRLRLRAADLLPGAVLASLVAFAASLLSRAGVAPFTLADGTHPLDATSLAILLGLLLGNLLPASGRLRSGIAWCTRVVLPLGIVLMGARLAFGDLVRVGGIGVLLALVGIGSCTLVVALLVRYFGLPVKLMTLVGVGTAICGGSAIAATAPAIEADDEDITWSIAAVALLGLVMMFLLPVVGHALGVDATSFGIWAGLTIHQTPQVVAAGLAYGGDAAEVATLIKLVRVALLAPMVCILGAVYARRRAARLEYRQSWWRLLPPFVAGFLCMALLRSLGWLEISLPLPSAWQVPNLLDLTRSGDRVALAIAMAAIGLETRFATFRRAGSGPLLAGVAAALAISVTTYAAISILL